MSAPTRPGSLASVLDAFTSGALTLDDIARTTGLHRDLVRVAVDQLVTLGLIRSEDTSTACPPSGCGGCSSPTGTGCGTGGAAQRGGLVTLTIGRRPGL